MEVDEYIETRLNDQIKYYDNHSKSNKRWYILLRIIEIFSAASIPILSMFISDTTLDLRVAVGIIGAIIAVITAIVSLCQFQENWVEYRTTCESLRHEKYLFTTKTEPYDLESSFPLFVKRIESLISKENSNWSQYIFPKCKRNHS